MTDNENVLVRKFAARCFGENWPVVLGVAEAIRQRAVAVPQVGDVQAVEEYFKAHVPVATWESAQKYADAVIEEWEVATGALSQREKAQRSKAALAALLDGDQSVLLQQQAYGGVEGAQAGLMMAQAAVQQAKDHRQRADAEAKVAKAQGKLLENQEKIRARRLAALMVVLGPEYSLPEEYEKVAGLAVSTEKDKAATKPEASQESEAPRQDAATAPTLKEAPVEKKSSENAGEMPKVSKSPILPKFLKK
ncbi:hypothetical protein ACUY2R_05095 [Corynebacterium mastitidis]